MVSRFLARILGVGKGCVFGFDVPLPLAEPAAAFTVEARKLEHKRPQTPNQRKTENQHT